LVALNISLCKLLHRLQASIKQAKINLVIMMQTIREEVVVTATEIDHGRRHQRHVRCEIAQELASCTGISLYLTFV
jgi:hypothetical protein